MPSQYGWYNTPSGWTALLPSNLIKTSVVSESFDVDYIVVGAGFAGVAAARELALRDPSAEVVLLESGELLQNSSARNSGFMIDLPYTKIDQRSNKVLQDWQTALMTYGRSCLWEQVKDDPILESYWSETGHYKGAATRLGSQSLQKIEETLKENNVEYKKVEGIQAEKCLGTDYYKSLLWIPHCTLVQPAALLRRLLQTLPQNVHVVTNSTVKAAFRNKNKVILQVGDHTLQAKKVVWAINSHLKDIKLERSKQLTVYTYACLTDPINATQQFLGEEDSWGLTPVEQLEATIRKLADGRLLFRLGFSYRKELTSIEQREMLYQSLAKRYPNIEKDQLSYVWGGAISMTRNGAPIFKRKNDREIIISGCNASGILKMTALGSLAAKDLLSNSSKLLAATKKHSKPTYIPPDPIRSAVVRFKVNQMKKELLS